MSCLLRRFRLLFVFLFTQWNVHRYTYYVELTSRFFPLSYISVARSRDGASTLALLFRSCEYFYAGDQVVLRT